MACFVVESLGSGALLQQPLTSQSFVLSGASDTASCDFVNKLDPPYMSTRRKEQKMTKQEMIRRWKASY